MDSTERDYRDRLLQMSTGEMLTLFQSNMTAICTAINEIIGEDNPVPDPRQMLESIMALSPRSWVEMYLDPNTHGDMRSQLRLMKVMEDVNRENRCIISRMLRLVHPEGEEPDVVEF